MLKSRLYSVFQSLSRSELRELKKLVRSPFFNQREYVARLYDYLLECHLLLQLPPENEPAFRFLFPQQSFDHPKLRLAMSLLLKLIEKYLVYKKIFADEVRTKVELAAIYRERKLYKQFSFTLKEAQQLQEKHTIRNAEYYNDRYRMQLEQYLRSSAEKHTEELNLQEISDTIDLTYMALKLRQTCLLLSHQTVYKTEYEFGLLADMLSHIESQGYLDIPAIAVYYYCYYALTRTAEEQYFRQFKDLLLQYSQHFSQNETRDLYLMAINYCIKRLNEGNQEYFREALDLYQGSLQQDYLLENGTLSRFTYNNAVAIGLWLDEFEWVESFISKYRDALEKRYRISGYSFNMARLEYRRRHYAKALQLLSKTDYRDILLNLQVKTYQLKIYYELKELDVLESHLDTMKTFIRRKKVIGYHQSNYLNIIRFTKKLVLHNPYDKAERQQLKVQIAEEDILTEKAWLLNQLQ
ncbi:MAG: hypothetical protein AAGG75_08200 [Bacteroidota bacterium]